MAQLIIRYMDLLCNSYQLSFDSLIVNHVKIEWEECIKVMMCMMFLAAAVWLTTGYTKILQEILVESIISLLTTIDFLIANAISSFILYKYRPTVNLLINFQ